MASFNGKQKTPLLAPAVINLHLNNFGFVPLLADNFRLLPSKSTPPRSVLFPSSRMSLLVVPPEEDSLLPPSLQEIQKFLRSNTNPFILVTPNGESDPTFTVDFAANLVFKCKSLMQDQDPQVVPAWSPPMAAKLIASLVMAGGDRENIKQEKLMMEAGDVEPLENRLAQSNLYGDRVEALLDLDTYGSLAALTSAGMDGKLGDYFVDFFNVDRELN